MSENYECSLCDKTLSCLDTVSKSLDGYSVLLGNGALMSNSKLVEKFPTNFLTSCYAETVKNIEEKYATELQSLTCPERFLNILRVEFSCEILKSYEGFFTKNKATYLNSIDTFANYLKKFQNIFTINYDSITYLAIIRASTENKTVKFKDGLYPGGDLTALEIMEAIDKDKDIDIGGSYFLHGAFHIFHYFDEGVDKYRKVTAKKGSPLKKELNESVLNDFRKFQTNQYDLTTVRNQYDLTTVIESRSQSKLAWIQNDPYLNFCFERLKKQKKILVLGCSFANDEHILEGILSTVLESLIIGIYQQSDLNNFYKAIKNLKNKYNKSKNCSLELNYDKISLVCSKNLYKHLWGGKVNSDKCEIMDLSLKKYENI